MGNFHFDRNNIQLESVNINKQSINTLSVKNTIIDISLSALYIFAGFYINNFLLLTLLFVVFTLLRGSSFLYFGLLFTPIIELMSLVYEGFTITRLIIPFAIIYLLFKNNFRIKIDKITVLFLSISIFYLFSPLVGLINGNLILLDSIYPWITTIPKAIDSSLTAFLKVITGLILYLSIQKDKDFDLDFFSLNVSAGLLILIILLIIRGITSYSSSWYGAVVRYTFIGQNSNELSIMLSVLSIFSLNAIIVANRYLKIIPIASYMGVLYILSYMLSKAGFIGFIVGLITFIIYSDSFKSRIHRYLFSIIIVCILCFSFFLNPTGFKGLLFRFSSEYTGGTLSGLTTHRSDFIGPAILGFLKRPFFGWGPSGEILVNFYYTGISYVTHNTFLEVLVNNGLICFSLWIILLFYSFFRNNSRLSIIIILVLVICSMSGSLATQDFLWIMWGFALGIASSGSGSNWSVLAHKNNWLHRLFF